MEENNEKCEKCRKDPIDDKKVVIMNGFSNGDVFKILKSVKTVFPKEDIIFATVTAINRDWTVKELIDGLILEHEQMKKIGKK